MSEVDGLITDVKRCAVHDGPGLRTTVFLKGCPIRCKWCHNPEALHSSNSLMFFADRCIGCGACAENCPTGASRITGAGLTFDRRMCTACGKCVPACPADARRLAGRNISLAELLEEVTRDVAFYQASGGGVTLSGGEPLMQPHFARRFLESCKQQKLHTVLDTSGQGNKRDLEQILAFTDMVLFDLKVMDPGLHRQLTGIGNEDILANLQVVDSAAVPVLIRVPLVLSFADELENLRHVLNIASSLSKLVGIQLLPAHDMARRKYDALGMSCEFEPPLYTDEQRRRLADLVSPITHKVDTSAPSVR